MTDYFWLWIVLAFLAGRWTVKPILYIGPNEEKYKAADFAILTRH